MGNSFIKENLINDDLIANSFQPTISGSPYVVNKKGGISFSAFMKNTPFSNELIKTLKLMQPLEFTDIQYELPFKLLKGKSIAISEGFNFKVNERRILGEHFFSAFSSKKYNKLNYELVKRDTFKGEYSIACSLTPKGDDTSELLNDVISKFIKTEIMHPFSTDELKYSDIDLSRIQKSINEDLWLQIVDQKQRKPVIVENNSQITELRQSLIFQWQVIFESLRLKKNSEHAIKVYSAASYDNIIRVAQAMARDEQKDRVDEYILNKSFKLFVETSEGLINNPHIQHQVKFVIPQRYESAKFNAVRAELSKNLLDINQLFSNIKEYFKDIYELQAFVDKLKLEGRLFEPNRGFYRWI